MGWEEATGWIFDCDGCLVKSKIQDEWVPPKGWVLEDDEVFCEECLAERPCGHYNQQTPKNSCDICQGKRCPDCLLQLDQQWFVWDTGPCLGDPRKLLGVRGHLASCGYVARTYKLDT